MAGAVLAVLVMLMAAPAPAQAGFSCNALRRAVTVDLDIPQPTIDNSLPQPALQRLAGPLHHRGRTQGLYRSDLRWTWRATTRRWTVNGETCIAIETVVITISMPTRRIYIMRERRPGTCAYDSVLAHERKHQRTDDGVLGDYVPRLRQAAENAVARSAEPIPAAKAAAVEAALTRTLGTGIEHIFDELQKARTARQAAVDSPAEYNRVRAACG